MELWNRQPAQPRAVEVPVKMTPEEKERYNKRMKEEQEKKPRQRLREAWERDRRAEQQRLSQ